MILKKHTGSLVSLVVIIKQHLTNCENLIIMAYNRTYAPCFYLLLNDKMKSSRSIKKSKWGEN